MSIKKIVCAVAVALVVGGSVSAANAAAIGLRIGGSSITYGYELNYQMPMGDNNRLEIGGLFSPYSNNYTYYTYSRTYMGLAGIYQWTFDLPIDGMGWYAGAGAQFQYVMYSWKYKSNSVYYGGDYDESYGYMLLGVGGDVGVEYNFSGLPLQVTIDARPMWNFMGRSWDSGFGYGYALGIRYVF